MTDPLLNRVFGGKYTLQKMLAAGSHGAVYEASSVEEPQRVAVKILRANTVKNPHFTKRFQREASVTSQLQSPYVVKVFSAGATSDGLYWIAMELLSGQTLASYLTQRGKLPLRELLALFSPLCEALREAHEKGFIHRDLKPQNVMLVTKNNALTPILLDFGIAAVQDEASMTSSGFVLGTPQFMAPEQWEGLRNATARSDLYSLGLMSYQALSGRMPYQAKNVMGWMMAHLSETPTPLTALAPELPQGVSLAVMKAIEKSAQDRFESVQEFYDELLRASQ